MGEKVQLIGIPKLCGSKALNLQYDQSITL